MKQNAPRALNILLVDDDDVDAMGIERAFRQQPWLSSLMRAKNGEEALDMLRAGDAKSPLIMLLDLNMPRMNGFETLAALRADETLRSTVVFVLTTSKNPEEIQAVYQHNVAGYIVKSSRYQDFSHLLVFLDHYWRLVELPVA